MILNSLEIKNFRGFKSFKISFTSGTNILIGRNGSGKSTLIDAIKIAISFIFSNNKQFGGDILSSGNPSLNVISFADSDFHYDEETRAASTDASIKGEAVYNNLPLSWELYKRSTANAGLYLTRYQDAFRKFMQQWKRNHADLPLIACFSDSFPHKPTKQTKFALDSINKTNIPRNFGYYQWAEDTACTSIWETRLFNQLALYVPLQIQMSKIKTLLDIGKRHAIENHLPLDSDHQMLKNEFDKLIQQSKPILEEIDYVCNRLRKFSGILPQLGNEGYDVDYFSIANKNSGSELCIVFKNGKAKTFDELPAGYRRLYSIVFELSYRAFILNGNKEPKGIVLIDEIDLHLHPSLEQTVVQCFRKVFPEVQFIMTSHSAGVIANLDTTEKIKNKETGEEIKANQILFMQEDQPQPEVLPVIYGLDSNATLRDFMGTPSRNEEMKKRGDEYLRCCFMGLTENADAIMSELIEKFGAEHDFIKRLQNKAKVYEVH